MLASIVRFCRPGPVVSEDSPGRIVPAGMSIDDLFRPMHLNFAFFGMTPLPTFACYDVMKNP